MLESIPLAIALALSSLAAWDVGRRYLARERAKDREAMLARLAHVDDLSARVARLEAFVSTQRTQGTPRKPHLSGIG